MKCRGIIYELSSYLDGELAPDAVVEMEIHLAGCEDCRVIVDTTRKTIEIYCNAEPVPLPEDVAARLHEALFKRLSQKPNL
ncbi:MAG TPA: anti-sigma factor [Candidatus Acidoferrales bacterium]